MEFSERRFLRTAWAMKSVHSSLVSGLVAAWLIRIAAKLSK